MDRQRAKNAKVKWVGAWRYNPPAPYPARKGLLRASIPAPLLRPAKLGRGQHFELTLSPLAQNLILEFGFS